MNRWRNVWCLVLLAIGIPFFAANNAGAQQYDEVRAGGVAGNPAEYINFYIRAFSDPNGENASGMADYSHSGGESGQGEVSLLCVSGTRAVAAGLITQGTYAGSGFAFFVEDRSMSGQPDLIQIEILDSVPESCPAFAMDQPLEVFDGDVYIVDATIAGDSVWGEGVKATQQVYFSVGATSGPSGENASGRAFLSDAWGVYDAEVSQLCVSGNKAVLAGAIISGSAPLGYGLILHVQDNEDFGTPDLLRWELVNYVPDSCPAFFMAPTEELTSGDITVNDAVILQSPIADAGPDQSIHLGPVTLNGGGSSDPDGDYPLTYFWEMVSKPVGSEASLSDAAVVNPSFNADMPGDYIIRLIVTDSLGQPSAPDEVLVSTWNTPPVADAGPDQVITLVGTLVTLGAEAGRQSYDDDGDPITYEWSLVSTPAGSAAALSDPASATPGFTADVNGTYGISLVVRDPWTSSAADTMTVSFDNVKPVANAGGNQSITLGGSAIFDGSGSSDANLDPLSFNWSIISQPAESNCELSNTAAPQTELLPDAAGTYVVSLVVNDGIVDSDPDNVTLEVLSSPNGPEIVLQELIDLINGFDPSVFKNGNMAKAMTNKINAVLADIEQGNYAEALSKLEHDIMGKTDGCAAEGAPDKNDWIRNCEYQNQVYDLVLEAMQMLEGIM